MSSTVAVMPPADNEQRERALDASRSVLVQAPAGSGKTDLLTRRFLRLLAVVDDPSQIVAITFTKAAAAEMRHRILTELEKAAAADALSTDAHEFSVEALAARALARSRELNWDLVNVPMQLRISTIDAFCREIAVQQPLLAGLGGGLEILDHPEELYRRAARKTLEEIDTAEAELRESIETLLLWRDNSWQEMESLLVTMLSKRDRWMQDFVFASDRDWEVVRDRLERPFARAVELELEKLSGLLDLVPRAREEVLELARFACAQKEGALHRELAELAEFPCAPFSDAGALEDARQACVCLACFLLTDDGFRRRVDKRHGFPPEAKAQKSKLEALIADLAKVPGLQESLAEVCKLPPARYTDEDWRIVRACFVLLRQAAAHLRVEFAQAGGVDYIEVAQIAVQVLKGEEGIPDEGALAAAEGIQHLLVDEFQDTSRRQHQLLGHLIAAWPEREGRTCFVVGDPMQSIYFFRDADAELFPQVRDSGLRIPGDLPFDFDSAALRTNFRTKPSLIERLNELFTAVFEMTDGSGVAFTAAESPQNNGPVLVDQAMRFALHCGFMPCISRGSQQQKKRASQERVDAHERQVQEIVSLIREHLPRMDAARAAGKKYRIAVLGRAHTALVPIAAALRQEEIPFRAIDLEALEERPEVMDALSIARALLNPHDRLAWLGLLRAPWCGLSLADLHMLASADDRELLQRPVRELIRERRGLLSGQGSAAADRVLLAMDAADKWRSENPDVALGTWIERTWLRLGGADCVDPSARANVELLWRCLDHLPDGDPDIAGAALDSALKKLTALPDPTSDGNCGVQLMTIHKAKGLEFEVVIVPELQAQGGGAKSVMLSWLERGLAVPDENGEITEFLVAPFPQKGTDRGRAKAWVDREYKEREKQESRRILYVAATRAREQLHLFARAEFNEDSALIPPKNCLLETAWPALGTEVEQQYRRLIANRLAEPGEIAAIAATGEDDSRGSTATLPFAKIRRLPVDYTPRESITPAASQTKISGTSADPLYTRHEGGLLSRAVGIAIHAMLEELTRLRAKFDWKASRAELERFSPRIAAQVRSVGIDAAQATRIAESALQITLDVSQDAIGQWILSPRAGAESEARWAGISGGGVHTVRVDRVFRAGLVPGSDGDDAWWIIDYKTAHAEGLDPKKVLPEFRKMFAPQLEAYARMLRGLHGASVVVRAGLYYPRMKEFDFWEL